GGWRWGRGSGGLVAFLAYSSDSSKPSQHLPSFLATARVVPLPANGSSTRSLEFEQSLMMRPRSCSGIWQPWKPARSLKVPATRGKYHVSSWGLKPLTTSCGRRIQVSSGSRPSGLARPSAYVVCRADGTRIALSLNVNFFGSLTKWKRCAWDRLNFFVQLTPNV